MKKILVLICCIVATTFITTASDSKKIQMNQLPVSAQNFINQNFAKKVPSSILLENDLFDKEYTVIYANCCKIEFNKKGDWTEIRSNTGNIPTTVIPGSIAAYINKQHAGAKIIEIEKDRLGYEVKISGDKELKFDNNQKFVRYDD